MNHSYEPYVELGHAMGASHVVPFSIEQIYFDPRTILKCMYGCADWGLNHTCPSRPGNPSMDEYEKIFKRYRWGVIVHAHDKRTSQKASFEIERRAFVDGYYFAFSLSDCSLCGQCAAKCGEACRNVKQARPAFHSVGIDVFKTVRALGLPIQTLYDPENEEQNWYSAVFIE